MSENEIKKRENNNEKLLTYAENVLSKILLFDERKEVVKELFHQVFGVEPNLVTIKNGITYAETTICTSKATKIVETIMPIDNERQRGCITFQVSEISEPESYEQLKEWVDEAIKSLKEAKWYLGSWKDTLFLEVKHFTIKMVFYTEPWY